jgi:hypothetical protein
MREHTHDFESVVTLQNCVAVLRNECDLCTDTCQTSSGDGNQFLFVNAEEFRDIEVEEDPKPSTSSVIKPEAVVSCVPVCVRHYAQCANIHSCLSHCLSTELFGLL